MKPVLLVTLIWLCLLAISGPGRADWDDDVHVTAQVSSQTVYAGDAFSFGVILDGMQQAGEVDLTPLGPFLPQLVSQEDVSSSHVTYVNGRVTKKITKRFRMIYQLYATAAGPQEIPAVTVTIKGKQYRTQAIQLSVIKPGETDKMVTKMTLSHTECYVGQAVNLSIYWMRQFNLNVGNDPKFAIPVLDDSGRFDFADPPSPPGKGGKAGTLPLSYGNLQARQYPQRKDGVKFITIAIGKILIPKTAGVIEIPASTVTSDIEVESQKTRRRSRSTVDDFFGQDLFRKRNYHRFQACSEALTLYVKPIPEEGRPSDFNGLMGTYSITASAAPIDNINIGDPITLKISVSGDLLSQVRMPDLDAIDELSDNFRIPNDQASPKIADNRKVFTQTLRPENDAVKAIPPIPISFFDVKTGKYSTVYSEPIPLKLSETRIVTANQAVGDSVSTYSRELESVEGGIAANYEGDGLFAKVPVSPLLALTQPVSIVVGSGPIACFLVVLLLNRVLASSPVRLRQKMKASAGKKAVAAVRKLDRAAGTGSEELRSKIADILRTFVGDRYRRTASSLTTMDCRQLLLQEGQDEDQVNFFCDVLEQCEQSRYAGGNTGSGKIDLSKLVPILNAFQRNG